MTKDFSILNEYVANPEIPIVYIPKFREYGISILDGGSSFLEMSYCPFTGKKLPESLRNRWFDEVEKLGMEPGDSSIPEVFNDERWWKEKKL